MFGWLDGATKGLNIFEVIDILAPYIDPLTHVPRYSGEVLDIGDNMNQWKKLVQPVFKAVDAITKAHWIRARLVDDEVVLEKKEFATVEWKSWNPIKRGQKMPDVGELENIVEVELPKRKVKDLQKALKFIPGGKLSYVPEPLLPV